MHIIDSKNSVYRLIADSLDHVAAEELQNQIELACDKIKVKVRGEPAQAKAISESLFLHILSFYSDLKVDSDDMPILRESVKLSDKVKESFCIKFVLFLIQGVQAAKSQ